MKSAEGKARCKHARPGVIVLGEGQGTFLQVCIAKKQCEKHWSRPATAGDAKQSAKKQEEERKRQEEVWAKQRADAERWRKELRPQAVRLVATRAAKLSWSRMLLRLLLEEIQVDDLFIELVGKPETLPLRRYPQAVAVALTMRHSWQRDRLLPFTKRLGVKLTAKDLAAHANASATDSAQPQEPPNGTRKTTSTH